MAFFLALIGGWEGGVLQQHTGVTHTHIMHTYTAQVPHRAVRAVYKSSSTLILVIFHINVFFSCFVLSLMNDGNKTAATATVTGRGCVVVHSGYHTELQAPPLQ